MRQVNLSKRFSGGCATYRSTKSLSTWATPATSAAIYIKIFDSKFCIFFNSKPEHFPIQKEIPCILYRRNISNLLLHFCTIIIETLISQLISPCYTHTSSLIYLGTERQDLLKDDCTAHSTTVRSQLQLAFDLPLRTKGGW